MDAFVFEGQHPQTQLSSVRIDPGSVERLAYVVDGFGAEALLDLEHNNVRDGHIGG